MFLSSYKQMSLNLQYLSFHFLWAHFSLLHSPNLNQTEKAFHLLYINYCNQAPVQHNPAPPHLTTDACTAMTKLDVLLKDKINVYITDSSWHLCSTGTLRYTVSVGSWLQHFKTTYWYHLQRSIHSRNWWHLDHLLRVHYNYRWLREECWLTVGSYCRNCYHIRQEFNLPAEWLRSGNSMLFTVISLVQSPLK